MVSVRNDRRIRRICWKREGLEDIVKMCGQGSIRRYLCLFCCFLVFAACRNSRALRHREKHDVNSVWEMVALAWNEDTVYDWRVALYRDQTFSYGISERGKPAEFWRYPAAISFKRFREKREGCSCGNNCFSGRCGDHDWSSRSMLSRR
jgi:hypothetical protein